MDQEYLLKAIAYKTRHRGSKECDLILKSFVESVLQSQPTSHESLQQLLDFVDRDDFQVFSSPENSATEFHDLAQGLLDHQRRLRNR